MKEFWNERYANEYFIYGEEPNVFFKEQLSKLKPGKILMPADGEGRNGVYAAKCGWEVSAFDLSIEGKKKAESLAAKNGVNVNYHVGDFREMGLPEGYFDAMGLIFAHFSADSKAGILKELITYLKPGATVIFEAFSKNHLKFSAVNPKAGGPKDVNILYNTEEVQRFFPDFEIIQLEEKEVEMQEGEHHVGMSSVIRFVGKKK